MKKNKNKLLIIGLIILGIGALLSIIGFISVINDPDFKYVIFIIVGFVLVFVGMIMVGNGLTSHMMKRMMSSSIDAMDSVSDDLGEFSEKMLDEMEPIMKKRAKIVTPIVSDMAGEVAKSVKDAVTEEEEYKYCTNCGQKISTKNKFCTNCGQKTNFK